MMSKSTSAPRTRLTETVTPKTPKSETRVQRRVAPSCAGNSGQVTRFTWAPSARSWSTTVRATAAPPTTGGAGRVVVVLGGRVVVAGGRVVADGRRAFVTRERFPEADKLLQAWPEEAFEKVGLDASTYVCVLSHDPKFDEPALQAALRSPAAYVGAIGSKKTQANRRERLREAGFTEEQLDRLRGPIGLDLGGRHPAETALAILAEMTAVRYGGSGRPMQAGRQRATFSARGNGRCEPRHRRRQQSQVRGEPAHAGGLGRAEQREQEPQASLPRTRQ